jgi:hypothetical protein
MDERELERIAAGLGREAAGLDVEAVARGVVARLRAAEAAAPEVAQPRPLVRWLAGAAAAALVVAGSLVTFRAAPPASSPAVAVATDLYDLSSAELTEVLDSLSWSAPASARVAVGLDDLDAEQLATLLALMEG